MVGTFSPTISGSGEGLEIEFSRQDQRFNQLCLHDETSIKTLKRQVWDGATRGLHRDRGPELRTLPDFALHTSSPGCSFVSFVTNFNSKYSIFLGGLVGNPKFIVKSDRSVASLGTPGTHYWHLK